jgi:hypothetical protein
MGVCDAPRKGLALRQVGKDELLCCIECEKLKAKPLADGFASVISKTLSRRANVID